MFPPADDWAREQLYKDDEITSWFGMILQMGASACSVINYCCHRYQAAERLWASRVSGLRPLRGIDGQYGSNEDKPRKHLRQEHEIAGQGHQDSEPGIDRSWARTVRERVRWSSS